MPNLRDLDKSVHKAIIFDEASPALVLKHKVLFQAGCRGVYTQESNCQIFAQWRFLYQMPMIVCTNRWVDEDCMHKDEEWLVDNSVVVRIEESCFLPGSSS